MKILLTSLISLVYFTISAQVPMLERKDIKGDSGAVLSIEAPTRETAPDEVYGVSYEKDGKKSFIMGNQTKKGLYDQINFVQDNSSYIVKKGNLYGIANKKAEIIVKIEYDTIGYDHSKGKDFLAKQNGKYGKITSTGEITLPFKYNKIIAGNQNITMVKNNKNETQVIFNSNNKVLQNNIEYIEIYQDLAILKTGGKFGVIKSEIVVPFEYDSIFVTKQNPRNIPIGNRKNDKKVKVTNPLIKTYQSITALTLQKANKFGLVNNEGKIIYSADNDEVYNNEIFGYCSVKKGNLYGIYFSKSKTKMKTEIEFDQVTVDGYGAVMASKDKKMGVFNLDGIQVVPFEYDQYIMQYSGYGYRVSKDKKSGILNYQGKVIVPIIYDDIETFDFGSSNLFKVKNDKKYGIVSREGKLIIPLEFEYIDDLEDNYLVITPQQKVGLYDKNGNIIVPVEYKWISKTATENSNVLVLKKEDYSFNFLDKNNKIILPENISEYGYVLDEYKLKNPEGRRGLLYVKSKNGKFGLLNEMSGMLDVPMVYDEIKQCTSSSEGHSYFSARKGKKTGLINEKNEVLIPIIYDVINLSYAISTAYFNENKETENKFNDFQVVAAKGNKYGTVNLKNEVVIPFQYSFLQRISYSGLFKAKKGKQYQIIDKDGKFISKNTFDEVANFERVDNNYSEDYILQGLTFTNGKMRVIDSKGNFITEEKPMHPHIGYETFDELKFALIEALDSKDDALLKEFVDKIAPSEHILYYLKQNLFDKSTLYVNIDYIKEKYLRDLLIFKHSEWNADTSLGFSGYNRSSLNVIDYTIYSERYGIVTNTRTSDHAYGDTHFMEKLLRDAIKINGYWISTYFMTRRFDRN